MEHNTKNKQLAWSIYPIFIWHALFLALTMSMIDFNTVFPALVSTITESKVTFGLLYSIMLGVSLVFNIVFSHFMKNYAYKKKFLLLGIYLRGVSFLGMAISTYFFAADSPRLVLYSLFFWITLFALSGGFAGVAYADIIGKLVPSGDRGRVYAAKQLAASIAAFVGGIIVSRVFTFGAISYPLNYSIILFIGFVGLFMAAIAFWFIEEPESIVLEDEQTLWQFIANVPDILKQDLNFLRFVIVENIASFSLMILPFYMVFAQEHLAVDASFIGRYLLIQVAGTILSNVLWGVISSRFGSKAVVRTCILIGALIPILAMVLAPLGAFYFSLVFFMVGVVMSGRKVGFEPYLLDIAPQGQRTVYLGIRGTLNIFVVILPILGGAFISALGYYATFSVVSLVMLLGFLALKRDTALVRQ